jgi:hypothetical protein
MISDVGQALVRDGMIELPDKTMADPDKKFLKIKKGEMWGY